MPMKVIVSLATALLLLFSAPLSALAAPIPNNIEVAVTSCSDTITVGETVTLTATIVKHGSGFEDMWEGAQKIDTILNAATGEYLATAVFEATQPGAFTIQYRIIETAGKSNVAFEGLGFTTVVVQGDEKEVTGAEIRDVSFVPLTGSDMTICGYRGEGRIYAIYSDYSSASKGTMFFVFGPEETSKTITVKFEENGITFSFPVTVYR